MEDKQRIVLSGAGDQRVRYIFCNTVLYLTFSSFKPGQPPEDVVFVLRCAQHDSFERAGDDLLMHVSITLSEALLGFSRILIKHLDGRGIHLRSPSGKIIKHHDSIVLRGEGMPKYKHPDQKGDLYVIFDIEMPDEQWLKSVDKKVRARSSMVSFQSNPVCLLGLGKCPTSKEAGRRTTTRSC